MSQSVVLSLLSNIVEEISENSSVSERMSLLNRAGRLQELTNNEPAVLTNLSDYIYEASAVPDQANEATFIDSLAEYDFLLDSLHQFSPKYCSHLFKYKRTPHILVSLGARLL